MTAPLSLPLDVLRSCNPCYNGKQLDRYRRIFDGGEAIQEQIASFLPKGLSEPQPLYSWKTKRASDVYENHLANIISNCDAELFAYPFDVRAYQKDGSQYDDPQGWVAAFKESCTKNSRDLKDFMRDRFVHAHIYGSSYFIIHQENGAAWLEAVETPEVIDYDWDDNGVLQYCVIRQVQKGKRESLASKNRQTVETFRVIDADAIYTYQLTYSQDKPPQDNAPVPLIGTEVHGFPVPPVIALRLEDNLALVPRAGGLQVAYFRLAFGLDWAMHQTNNPLPVFYVRQGENEDSVNLFQDCGLVLDRDDKFDYATPDASSFTAQQDALKQKKDEIYRTCNATTLSIDQHLNGSVARSGESKMLDAGQWENGLNRYGDLVRECVQNVFSLLSYAMGLDLRWNVTGLDRFALAIKGNPLDDTIKALEQLEPYSKTAALELRNLLVEKELSSVPQHTKIQIQTELRESANKQIPEPSPALGDSNGSPVSNDNGASQSQS